MVQVAKRHALILGATGAVGQQLLCQLVSSDRFAKVHAPSRRELAISHKKIVRHSYESFYQPWQLEVELTDFFYCFGSTQARAGSQLKLRELELATAHQALVVAKQTGAKNFYLVSAQGISPQSWVPYLRMKAEVEKILKDHRFTSIYIYRPSLLLSPREEIRPLELVAQKLLLPVAPLWQSYLPRRAPVQAEQVARAILADAHRVEAGVFVRENRQIIELASWLK